MPSDPEIGPVRCGGEFEFRPVLNATSAAIQGILAPGRLHARHGPAAPGSAAARHAPWRPLTVSLARSTASSASAASSWIKHIAALHCSRKDRNLGNLARDQSVLNGRTRASRLASANAVNLSLTSPVGNQAPERPSASWPPAAACPARWPPDCAAPAVASRGGRKRTKIAPSR